MANGVILTLLKNVRPEAPPKTLSFVATTPKPRLVKLAEQSLYFGGPVWPIELVSPTWPRDAAPSR